MRIAAFIALCVLAFPGAAVSQQNFDTVQVRTQKVADGVYMLIGAGGNIGLAIGDDAVFVVDDQYAPLTPKVLAAIAALTSKPVRFVVNTHWHGDHTGGNEHMGQAGALLVAQDNVRRRLSTQQVLAFFKDTVPAAPAGALPVITFSDTITFHINGDDVQAFHIANAHTDGDAFIVWRKADVVHAGDVFVTYGFPFIDLDSGGSIDGMIAGCDVLLTLGDDSVKIIPGHGPLSERRRARVPLDAQDDPRSGRSTKECGPHARADAGHTSHRPVRREMGRRVHQARSIRRVRLPQPARAEALIKRDWSVGWVCLVRSAERAVPHRERRLGMHRAVGQAEMGE
jgi:glyoxylase-like metal-dependent hydrolase (beta-lactamase superfamily II)